MKAVAEAALGLPWISPCASSLVSLAKDGPTAWKQLRADPGAVLLAARAAGMFPATATPIAALLGSPAILLLARDLVGVSAGCVDWSAPGPARIHRLCLRQAALAHVLARNSSGCDPDKAWVAGLLAPLGWLALCAVDTECAALAFASACEHGAIKQWRPDGLSRRLARSWNLPDWLGATIGHLGLHVGVARRLGAEPRLFQVVQLACILVQREEKLPLAPSLAENNTMQSALGLSADSVDRARCEARGIEDALLADSRDWQPPSAMTLLPEFLELALAARRRNEVDLVERLHGDLDHLQAVLEEHQGHEKDRLNALKLSALAELAAGAGHEINNPLAVISGEAQYALKQINHAEAELVEDAAALAVLHETRGRMERSLQAIVGQAQRIHHVLTDLMQFARPAAPRRQSVCLLDLLRAVAQAVRKLAEGKKVRLVFSEPPENWRVHADPSQMRAALLGMLRNAIEAAPAEGWAGLRAEARDNAVGVIVEDNGPGPTPLALEHMFDPFFSGRSAGRGRGLGLSTAWRLTRQNGGDVRFEGIFDGTTRFVMTLADLEVGPHTTLLNGNADYAETTCNGVNGDGVNASH